MSTLVALEEDRHYPAHYAARMLGKPQQAMTFTRRAREAFARGDDRVYKIGRNYYAAPSFWRSISLREAGRPSSKSTPAHAS